MWFKSDISYFLKQKLSLQQLPESVCGQMNK